MRNSYITVFVLFCVLLLTKELMATVGDIPVSSTSQAANRKVSAKLNNELKRFDAELGDPIFIRIFKKERILEVWLKQGLTYTKFKTYSICHYSGNLGPKLKEGDKQSPEGFYTVEASQLNPHSSYHLSFNIGFPNAYDRTYKRTGSLLMVHGSCTSAGCFAMTDHRMEEIYTIVESAMIGGQHQIQVHIFPFKMTEANLALHQDSKWIHFWNNLKEGYDYFEGHRAPPLVKVVNKQYQFSAFPSYLFGGDLPVVSPEINLAKAQKESEQYEPVSLVHRIKLHQKKRILSVRKNIVANKRKALKQPLYAVKNTKAKRILPAPAGLGD